MNVVACIDMHAIACNLADMAKELLDEIDAYLEATGLSGHRFGILAARNGRLVERLRAGGRVWPETAKQVRAYLKSQKQNDAAA